MTDHIIQKRTTCDFCGIEMPKGYLAVEDDNGRLYCSSVCFEDDADGDEFEDDDERDADAIIV